MGTILLNGLVISRLSLVEKGTEGAETRYSGQEPRGTINQGSRSPRVWL